MMMLMVMRRVDAFVRSSTPWMLLKFLQRFLVGTVLYQSRAEAGDGPEAYQGLRMSEEGLVREMISDVPPDQNPFEFQKPSIVGLGLPNVPNYADDLLIFFMLIESLIILGSTFLVIFPLINGPEMRKRHLWIWHKSYLGTTGKTLTTFFLKKKRIDIDVWENHEEVKLKLWMILRFGRYYTFLYTQQWSHGGCVPVLDEFTFFNFLYPSSFLIQFCGVCKKSLHTDLVSFWILTKSLSHFWTPISIESIDFLMGINLIIKNKNQSFRTEMGLLPSFICYWIIGVNSLFTWSVYLSLPSISEARMNVFDQVEKSKDWTLALVFLPIVSSPTIHIVSLHPTEI